MKTDILIAGFGGQGIMSLGRILAKIAMKDNKNTTYFPSYGAEVRGGTAHCFVRISDLPIASPFIEDLDIAVILNQPSLDKFKNRLKKGSLLIFNEDLKQGDVSCPGVEKVSLPLNQLALACGSVKAANIAALGALVSAKPNLFKRELVLDVIKETFKGQEVIEQNIKAFCLGEKSTIL